MPKHLQNSHEPQSLDRASRRRRRHASRRAAQVSTIADKQREKIMYWQGNTDTSHIEAGLSMAVGANISVDS